MNSKIIYKRWKPKHNKTQKRKTFFNEAEIVAIKMLQGNELQHITKQMVKVLRNQSKNWNVNIFDKTLQLSKKKLKLKPRAKSEPTAKSKVKFTTQL